MARYREAYYVLVCAAVLIAPPFAFAWGPKGHQIVALIAEAHLNASTRDKIKAILPKNDTLAKAAVWSDEAKISKTSRQFGRCR
jgi:nuclease S1